MGYQWFHNPKKTARRYKDNGPIESACFPGDARVTLVDPATGAAVGATRMSELAIGDVIECLRPAGLAEGRVGDYRDSAQDYVTGACHVFGYDDADAVGWPWAAGACCCTCCCLCLGPGGLLFRLLLFLPASPAGA